MSWGSVLLLGSGLLFSTGLVWFFVQAWMFAIEAETAWLIILLTITSTVALLSQSYLCAVVLSINPNPKPAGVTPVNREAFASFPFDATASLIRRRGSDHRPSIGWEVHSYRSPSLLRDSGIVIDETPPDIGTLPSRVRRARVADGVYGPGMAGDEEEQEQEEEEEEKLPMRHGKQCRAGRDVDKGCGVMTGGSGGEGRSLPQQQPFARWPDDGVVAGAAMVAAVEAAAAAAATAQGCVSPTSGGLSPSEAASGGVGSANRRRERGIDESRIEPDAGCVEDAVGSDVSKPSVALEGSSTAPLDVVGSRGESEGSYARLEDGVYSEVFDAASASAGDYSMQRQDQEAKRHRWKGALELCSTLRDDGNDQPVTGCGTAFPAGRNSGSKEAESSVEVVELGLLRKALSADRDETLVGTPGTARLGGDTLVRVSELPDECAICLGQYATGEEVHVLPCLHIFHAQCLDVWINGHPSCPYCKGDLNVLPSEYDDANECAFTRRLLAGLTALASWPVARIRDRRGRRRHGPPQDAVGMPLPTAMPSPAMQTVP